MDRGVELGEFVSARGAAPSRASHLLMGGHQAAEDLVQDTCSVLIRRWQKSGVDPEATPAGSWTAGSSTALGGAA